MKYLWTEDHFNDDWYHKIQARHKPLWNFVKLFIEQNNIQSVFEVGGGPAPLRNMVKKYTNIDVNEKYKMESTENFKQIIADFMNVEILSEDFGPDLFLAMGVVEHCEHYKKFIEKTLSLNPKFIIISFFFGLNRSRDKIKKRVSNRNVSECYPYWTNCYSRVCLEEFLKEKGVLNKSHIISLLCSNGMEDVLIINLRSEVNFARDLNNLLEGLNGKH